MDPETIASDSSGARPLDRRAADLRRLADSRWDVLVVGGGITGAGILLDAVSRGLSAALVEQEDIASGTSSRSSRLIHGGLRYLEQFQVTLVREALAERARMLDLAPHLVRLEPLLFPLYGPPALTRAFFGAGIGFYDVLGSARRGGRSHHLSKARTLELAPPLRREGLQGGILYHDGVEDDARYTLEVARTATSLGGVAATRVQAEEPIVDGGRIAGVRVRDLLGGESLDVRSDRVIDATGVWEARPESPFGGNQLIPSRGSHLVVPRERIPIRHGMTIRVPGKVVFLVPWPEFWLVGTTDAPYDGIPDHPSASPEEVRRLLDVVNATLDVDLTADDVVGTYAGLRPLVGEAKDGGTVKVSREHKVRVEPNGLVRISGGKYTTYRLMARDAVDAALDDQAKARPSRTDQQRIRGAASRQDLALLGAHLTERWGLPARTAERLVTRHGTEAVGVARLGEACGLLGPLVPGRPFIEAEVAWAVREELALSLDDVLSRRFRLSMELPDRGRSIAPRVADLVGDVLGWDAGRRAAEVDAYLATADREYSVPAV